MTSGLARGDVVLVSFPFTDLSGRKLRKSAAIFKLAKLVCLHQSLILRKLGHVSPAIQRELDVRLSRAVGLS